MIGGIIALVLTGTGVVLVGIGVGVSLSDRRKKQSVSGPQAQGTAGEVQALAKLAEALKDYPLGLQLIFLGIACMVFGGGIGGISAIA
jgi:hypothetical protein